MKAKNMLEFHKLVCERESYICQGCGKDFSADYYFDDTGERNLYVFGHHNQRRRTRPDLVLETDNGICTCDSESKCHTKHHKGLLIYKPNT